MTLRQMPYSWISTEDKIERLHLWPHRSLPKRGFVFFIAGTAAAIALPLISVLGTPVLWALLPFLALAVMGIWWALMRSYRDTEIIEDLVLASSHMELTRHGPHGRRHHWQANPYWVAVNLYKDKGPVPNYLTLKGDGREVELGAFLTAEERHLLADEVQERLARLR